MAACADVLRWVPIVPERYGGSFADCLGVGCAVELRDYVGDPRVYQRKNQQRLDCRIHVETGWRYSNCRKPILGRTNYIHG